MVRVEQPRRVQGTEYRGKKVEVSVVATERDRKERSSVETGIVPLQEKEITEFTNLIRVDVLSPITGIDFQELELVYTFQRKRYIPSYKCLGLLMPCL